MGWTKALEASQLGEGEKQAVTLGDREILLVRDQGTVYATAARCPHMRARLVRGTIRDGAIVCPLHHSAFSLATGDVKAWSPWPPGIGRVLGAIRRERALQVYEAREVNGRIQVNVPE